MMTKVAVFASGTGSNFKAMIETMKQNQLKCDIVMLVCDKPMAPVINLAKEAGIPVFTVAPKHYPDKTSYEKEIAEKLKMAGVEWLFLAGYMRLIGDTLLTAYPNHIVNIHPSLLPAFPGKDAISQAYHAGVKVTGVTIHYVDAGMDTGEIIAQEATSIEATSTEEDVKRQIQQMEHALYPHVINQLMDLK